jgi:pyruvate ferredoxin oxidoreductase gamma subunit/phenylglyoxylate dehydrogenase gamma subunit
MYEIRFHGRGGQGSVMGAEMFAKALLNEGKYAVTIPAFGFERRGAPVQSYLKFDENVIRQHTNVRYPDCIICIDPTLPSSVPIFDGIKENGVAILCTKKPLEKIELHPNVKKVALCDATTIAVEVIGRRPPITNTIMLGAAAKTLGVVSLESLNVAMKATAFRDAALEMNIKAVQRGYDETKIYEL